MSKTLKEVKTNELNESKIIIETHKELMDKR